jgi:hypothetical protein
MLRLSSLATVLVASVAVGGCSLDVSNPNDPDVGRAFADPAGLTQLLGGTFRTWVDTRGSYWSSMVLDAQADNYTASWNNAAIRFYNSVGVDCPSRCGWTNSSSAPEAAGGRATEYNWYGYYTMLSSATDVLRAIDAGICFDDDCNTDNTFTSRNKAIAKMIQGFALAGIAVLYDQGFVVDETTDLSNPTTLPFSTRAEVRDAALQKLEEAYAEAGTKTWETEAEWMGVDAGQKYTNDQIKQVIRTAEAELIAMFPRCAIECTNALPGDRLDEADWAAVAQFASQGVSAAGAGFNWEFYIDANSNQCGLDCVKVWGNSIGTERVDTRVAALITTNHVSPWPSPGGNPCPTTSPDKRVGDGSWGSDTNFNGYGTLPATANAGTDFACATVVIFPPARGSYHQSNLAHIRYNHLAYIGEDLPQFDATGQDPMYTTEMNDLLWAEGLIRSGGSLAQAAQLINNSRVTRGGLPALTGAETVPELLAALQYEQEIEFMGQGSDPFFNRRRIDGFSIGSLGPSVVQSGTPRQMPVPAKELDVLVRAVYTFGGPVAPDMVSASGGTATRRETVRDRYEELRAEIPRRRN